MRIGVLILAACALPSVILAAAPSSRIAPPPDYAIRGGNPDFGKAVADTHVVIGPWGSGADFNGQFETPAGAPAWNGWTSVDETVPSPAIHWRVSPFNADNLNDNGPGNLAAWCGDPDLAACDTLDAAGGYGNSWDEFLQWTGRVADPTLPCLVTVDAFVNHDTEPGYDYSSFACVPAGQDPQELWVADGLGRNVPLHLEITLVPGEYGGENGDEVTLRFRFESDGGWSDQDCLFPTAGALQVDDITVSLANGGLVTFDDFESGLGHWQPLLPPGVGDFAQIWTGLRDLDPCAANSSPQVAFIDDGNVVPGTGGSPCIDWCYGPGGYIVTPTGGLAGPDSHIRNMIYSPPLPWPQPDFGGCVIAWDVYRHTPLLGDSPGISDLWLIRSTASADPADLSLAAWQDRDSGIRSGGPFYLRLEQDVSDLLVEGCRFVQLALGAWEWGWWLGYAGLNGTPAPYFDNVRVIAFPYDGPGMSVRSSRVAQDAFPEIGVVDRSEPGRNSVRFDSAQNIALSSHWPHFDPGDSIFCDISALRQGAEIVGTPQLHYKLQPNPVFDPYRTSGLPAEGAVAGWQPLGPSGDPITWGFAFDLPDTGFLFPGDVLHYFITATDGIGGTDLRTNHVPADTAGFGDFSGPLTYDPRFTVRALPSLDADLAVPPTLLWSLDANVGGREKWHRAMGALGLSPGVDYDTYASQSQYDCGLAGRATLDQVADYGTVLVSAASLQSDVFGTGDLNQEPDDIALLAGWLARGDRNLFVTGSHVADDLATNAGAPGLEFLTQWLGVSFVDDDVRPLIAGQTAPAVMPTADNPVFTGTEPWLAYDSCRPRKGSLTFDYALGIDAVLALPGARRLAEFTSPDGVPGIGPYTAATLRQDPALGTTVISLPYDLAQVRDAPATGKAPAPAPRRVELLADVFASFGVPYTPDGVTDVAPARPLRVAAGPNPFNPRTRIAFDLPRAGHVLLKIFDIRGTLVRTLVDARLDAGPGEVFWDGRDGRGAAVASGVYVYEFRALGETRVGKMALVR